MADSNVIIKQLYPVVETALKKNEKKFQDNIAKYINAHHDQMFDIAPYERIYFNQTDVDNFWTSIGIPESEVISIMQHCFFWDIPYNPGCVKEPYVMTLLMCVRYYLKNNNSKKAELTATYLAFSGKFYASIHAGIVFPKVSPERYKTVMDYVVNNMLSDKFDLKREGTVFGAIASMCRTWLDTYGQQLKGNPTDSRCAYFIQQLRDREKAFMKNIGKLYYEAYQNRSYMNYETDSLDPDEFRLTTNDAAVAARISENTINYMTSNYVSLEICNKCKDENVRATEIKDIMESIMADSNNLPKLRRIVNIIICDFMRNNPGKKVGGIDFVSYSIKAKPNTRDPLILEMKDIILSWLDENSPNYRKRRSRKATAASYYRSLLLYIILTINKVASK